MCCCRERVKRRIPLAEVWKRRLVLTSICLVIVTLGGLVMLAVELTKLQRNIYSVVTLVGFSITVAGLLPLYLILLFTICGHDQYPTGPVLIWANALYMLIGIALVCVAQIVPADSMFKMIPFNNVMEKNNNFSGLYPTEDDAIFTDLFTKYGHDITIQKNQAVWDRALIDVIQFRLSILGGGIFGMGVLGSAFTLIIIYKVHSLIEKMKKAEHIRRKNIRTLAKVFKPRNNNQPLRRLRDSVYDYAGWGNRTSDIFHDHEAEGRVSATSSTKLTSASMISIAEEGGGGMNHRSSRRVGGIHRNYEYVAEDLEEEEEMNGDATDRRLSGRSYKGMGISSIEMKELNTQIENDARTV